MATYRYSLLADGASLATFDPAVDTLLIDVAGVSAASVRWSLGEDAPSWRLQVGSKSFALPGTLNPPLTGLPLVFADGSAVVQQVLGSSYAYQLTGTAGADLLVGSPADSARLLASSAPGGGAVDANSFAGVVSGEGRWVAMQSWTTVVSVIVKDLLTGEVVNVLPAVSDAGYPFPVVFADDGRHVAVQDDGGTAGGSIVVHSLLAGSTAIADAAADGSLSNGDSVATDLSANGRYVVFHSSATNLTSSDDNGHDDVFVKDLVTGAVRNASGWNGFDANADSRAGLISADGRWVVFASLASNLPGQADAGASADLFLRDLGTGTLQRITGTAAQELAGSHVAQAISADGSRVLFASDAAGFVAGDSNGHVDLFVWDRASGSVTRVSTGAAGVQANGASSVGDLSGDGRYLVFASHADNLLAGVASGQVYVKDLVTGEIACVSSGPDGSTALARMPRISADGSRISYSAGDYGGGDADGFEDVFTVANPLLGHRLVGGAGNDAYVVGSPLDLVVEAAGGGTDTVRSHVGVTLPVNVENLELLGSAAINGTGNAANNVVIGNRGDNVLDGGAGTDTVSYATATEGVAIVLRDPDLAAGGYAAGDGNDSLLNFENAIGSAFDDAVTGTNGDNRLDGGAGRDEVNYSYASSGVTVNLSLTTAQATGGAGTDTLLRFEDVGGSAHADHLTGTAGANEFEAGSGNDTMVGLAGDDSYYVQDAGDVVVEAAGGGVDTVFSAVSYVLGANVENLVGWTAGQQYVGNALDNVLRTDPGDNHLDGAGGSDTLSFSRAYDAVSVSLGLQGPQATGHGALTLISIENLTGSDYSDQLTGNDGANRLDGGLGADTLSGGLGDDAYVVDQTGDIVDEYGVAGTDTVYASTSWTLFGGQSIERLVLTGTESLDASGNGFDNALTGNTAANRLLGGGGNDTLDGAGGSDTASYADALFAAVSVSLALAGAQNTGGGGLDTLISIENLVGSNFDDALTGNAGANRLDGALGADTLNGGAGNDSYVVDDASDTLVEAGGGGTDTVLSSVGWTLDAAFENLVLLPSGGGFFGRSFNGNDGNNRIDIGQGAGGDNVDAGAGADTLSIAGAAGGLSVQLGASGNGFATNGVSYTGFEHLLGSAFNDTLTGNALANRIDGGAGGDALVGGGGNDTYIVDDIGDRLYEYAGGGNDLVIASRSWTLGAELERLTLSGTQAIDGSGNALANVLTGNAGSNILDGGAGSDTVSYAGAASAVTVNLALGSATGGGGNDTLLRIERAIGSAHADTLIGGSTANVLTGGAGSDTLTGGGGADRFALDSTVGSDTLTDFLSGTDRLALRPSVLGIGDGDLLVEGGVTRDAPGGFASTAELVVFTSNVGALTASAAAAAIGSANSAYAVGADRVFVVDNGTSSAVFLFTAADANAAVSAAELTLLATLNGTASTALSDYQFTA